MKKLIILLCFAVIIIGCNKKEQEKKVEYFCDGMNDALDYFYEDDEYRYYFPTMPNHITYDGEKMSFGKAIEEEIITLKDVYKNCGYGKEPK